MNARWLLGFLCALLTSPAFAQGFAGLGSDSSGFTLPRQGQAIAFPRDLGPHPDYRLEWWYVTSNLKGDDGNDYGVQWTLFRTALAPSDAEGWASPQIWFGHAAVTTPTEHFPFETFARGGIGQAGVTVAPFEGWINDWSMVSAAAPDQDPLSAMRFSADGADAGFELSLNAEGPVVFHGSDGYSVKSERGHASYYYSQPFYTVQGVLRLPSGDVQVTGNAWLDREWSSQPLEADQSGWDWFSLHLSGGEKLMVYQLRDNSGGAFVPATLVSADGSTLSVPDSEITLTPLEVQTVAGRDIPVSWRITWPARDLSITTTPLNPKSWMALSIPYWEGPIRFEGTHEGVGYLEMTGYD